MACVSAAAARPTTATEAARFRKDVTRAANVVTMELVALVKRAMPAHANVRWRLQTTVTEQDRWLKGAMRAASAATTVHAQACKLASMARARCNCAARIHRPRLLCADLPRS